MSLQVGGATQQAHLEQLRRSGIEVPELEAAEKTPPPEAAFIWTVFNELQICRPYYQGGFGPLSYTEIKAWADLHGVTFHSWEVGAIRALDMIWMEVMRGSSGTEHSNKVDTGADRKGAS